jgi:hypothetical protein
LYVFNSNRWLVKPPLKVVHYTLGSFKPWNWWCGWLVEEQARWNVRFGCHACQQQLIMHICQSGGEHCIRQRNRMNIQASRHQEPLATPLGHHLQDIRMRLGPDAHGRRHGIMQGQAFAQTWLPLLPPLLGMLLARFVWTGTPQQLQFLLYVPVSSLPRSAPDLLAVGMGYVALIASAFLTWIIIPAAVCLHRFGVIPHHEKVLASFVCSILRHALRSWPHGVLVIRLPGFNKCYCTGDTFMGLDSGI